MVKKCKHKLKYKGKCITGEEWEKQVIDLWEKQFSCAKCNKTI